MFSTIDVMVAQAHIDQLNELADAKRLVKADRTFCIPSRTRGTTPAHSARPTLATGIFHGCWPGHGAQSQRPATQRRGYDEAYQHPGFGRDTRGRDTDMGGKCLLKSVENGQ